MFGYIRKDSGYDIKNWDSPDLKKGSNWSS